MKGLIALCLGLLALADASRSPIQQKALDLVLEFFHSRDLVQSTFKEQAVTQVAEMGLPMGTYVQLEVDLVQTLCRKQQWRTQSCRIKLGGRKQKCLACFKFGSSNSENILDQSLRCLSEQNPIFQEAKRKQNQDCEAVKEANEEHYQPGQFAFSKALPLS
ncbi:retinoic acid receptor responder protein 2 isoform X2 [Rhineura floridana]|uniref:retinoic acid receptor responder protein 2 isoform X2 n=1 Tax=Rhineura floridana TaxID=261503 RepID=UPI002AC7F03A|nr:retinoic acid receptor responder protein 2 isoform X2 [Rhineura floridana]